MVPSSLNDSKTKKAQGKPVGKKEGCAHQRAWDPFFLAGSPGFLSLVASLGSGAEERMNKERFIIVETSTMVKF